MNFGISLAAFAAIFPAELPDKTMITTVVLATRFRRPLAVWVGAAGAFTIHVVIAVLLGSFIGRLPKTPVDVVVAVLFAVGSVVLFRESTKESEHADAEAGDGVVVVKASARQATVAAFLAVLLAEWGDLTQLATASLAARSDDPLAVGIGALLALWAVAAIAATAGRALTRWVPTKLLHRIAGVIFALLAVGTLAEAFL